MVERDDGGAGPAGGAASTGAPPTPDASVSSNSGSLSSSVSRAVPRALRSSARDYAVNDSRRPMLRRHVRLRGHEHRAGSTRPSRTHRPEPPDRALAAAETLARWLDGRFLDPLLGLLLPGVGDLLGSALGLYPVLLAWQRRAPKALLARMLLNLAADAAGGAIPVIGDIWDFCSARTPATCRCCAPAPATAPCAATGATPSSWPARCCSSLAALAMPVAGGRLAVARGVCALTAGARKACPLPRERCRSQGLPSPGPSRKRERESISGRGSARRRWRPCSRCPRR